MAQSPYWEKDSEDESFDFTAVGMTMVQGQPVPALAYIKNSKVERVITLNPEKDSSALREFQLLVQRLWEEMM